MCTGNVTSAVSHCHNLGVAHRDIKLENLLLRSNDIAEGLLLADFGLATKADHGHLCYDKVGTVPYRAPEVGASGYSTGTNLTLSPCGLLFCVLC